MLDVLRRGASSWVAKLLMILLVLSFAVWGIADVFRSGGSDTVARVGSTKISAREFDVSWRRELDALQRQTNTPISKERAIALGLPNRIVSHLVTDAVVEEEAAVLGLGISDEATDRLIAETKSFAGPDGKFDPERARALLQQNGLTTTAYFRMTKRDGLRRQLINAAAPALPVPNILMQFQDQYENEERTVAYIALTAKEAGEITAPTAEELAKFFEERKASFKSQELRAFSYVTIAPTDIVRPDDISDEDARAYFTSNSSNFGTPEQRRIEQLPFDTLDAARAASAELKAGKSFEDLIAARNMKAADIDLGLMPRSGYLDQAIAEIAFELPSVGAVSEPISGKGFPVLVRLVETKPANLPDFAVAAKDIKAQLARAKGLSQMGDVRDQIEDARAGGAKLDDIAKRFNLKAPASAKIDRTGMTPEGKPAEVPDLAKVARAVFTTESGAEAPPVAVGGNTLLLLDVTAIDPSRERTLDEVKAEVLARWNDEQVRLRLAKLSDDLAARVEKGESIEEVAKSVHLDAAVTPAFKRGKAPEPLSGSAATAAFTGPEGSVSTAISNDGGRFVLQVKDVSVPMFLPPSGEPGDTARQIAADVQNSSVDQMVRQLRADYGVQLNQALINQVIGASQAN